MGLRPTKVLKNSFSPETAFHIKVALSFCHLDRSEAQWRDLCVDAPSWRRFSTEA
jgi:hypothetical protein